MTAVLVGVLVLAVFLAFSGRVPHGTGFAGRSLAHAVERRQVRRQDPARCPDGGTGALLRFR